MLTFPEQFNAAAVFVDSHLEAGRGPKAAILCGDEVVTYRDLHERVNRFGNALTALDVRMEERVAILMPDSPELVYAFFGAIKIGAVAVPVNTMLMPRDYLYLLNDSRARVLVVHDSLFANYDAIRTELKFLAHVIVVGTPRAGCLDLSALMREASPELKPAETSKDDSAFWLYSSGTTGFPKGTIHLHHDMMVESEFYGRQTIGVTENDVGNLPGHFASASLYASENADDTLKPVSEVTKEDMILDIGPQSAQVLADIIAKAGTVVWNGPVGVFEFDQFASGTQTLAKAIADSPAFSIAGGGDTLAAIAKFGVTDKISYISTGGGAFLEFLEGKELPAVAILAERA